MANLGSRKVGSNYGRRRPGWHISNFFAEIDSFGKELPSFNIKGETHVNTVFGGIMTFNITLLAILYAFLKMNVLMNRMNPNISVTKVIDNFGMYERINMNEIGYRMAFVIENFDDKKTKADPKYVKYIARIW